MNINAKVLAALKQSVAFHETGKSEGMSLEEMKAVITLAESSNAIAAKAAVELTRMERIQAFLDAVNTLDFTFPHNAMNFVSGMVAMSKDKQRNEIVKLPIVLGRDVLMPDNDLRHLNNINTANMFAFMVFVDLHDAKPN